MHLMLLSIMTQSSLFYTDQKNDLYDEAFDVIGHMQVRIASELK